MKSKQKNGYGGKRAGAGRPITQPPKIKVSLAITKTAHKVIGQHGESFHGTAVGILEDAAHRLARK